MAEVKKLAAPLVRTVGQVAYEAFRKAFDTGKLQWHELKQETRDGWEYVARAARSA